MTATRPKYPDCGEREMLRQLMKYWASIGLRLKLFTNAITPGPSTLIEDFSECSFPGYPTNGGIPLTEWGPVFTDAAGETKSMHPCVHVEAAETNNTGRIYGWYIVDGEGYLISCERTAMGANGDVDCMNYGGLYTATPIIPFNTEF